MILGFCNSRIVALYSFLAFFACNWFTGYGFEILLGHWWPFATLATLPMTFFIWANVTRALLNTDRRF